MSNNKKDKKKIHRHEFSRLLADKYNYQYQFTHQITKEFLDLVINLLKQVKA